MTNVGTVEQLELWDITSGDVNWYNNIGKWSICFIKGNLTHIIWFNSSIPTYFLNENIFPYQDLYSNIHCTLINKSQKLGTILILPQVNGEKNCDILIKWNTTGQKGWTTSDMYISQIH